MKILKNLNIKKNKPKTYAESLGSVKRGKVLQNIFKTKPQSTRHTYNVYVAFPKKNSGSPDKKMHADILAVEKLLSFLKIEVKRLENIQRLGKSPTVFVLPKILNQNTVAY